MLLMAQAEVNSKGLREGGEIVPSDSENQESGSNAPKTHNKRRSRYDILEEQWKKKISTLDNKLDGLIATIQASANSTQSQNSSNSRKRRSKFTKSPSVSDSSDEDAVSLYSQTCHSPSHSENNSSDENNINSPLNKHDLKESTKKCLYEIFGDDATNKKTVKKDGICVDLSQKEVLEDSYHCKTPRHLTAFSEENYNLFPVDEQTECYLQVPTLDPLIENLLLNRHGSKASFKKSKAKT
ncbi:uncharacterized protein LOC128557097 [Mercenaria mercenaria]|uniref:uncharacterized protein LOC128557097 n=1 Tax=Mercenaria mercenaria TaxID=6596 RepID=UPI00234EAB94|nr:uncharacterized protein LOC128557097 [Mercenaria mercenaria]